MTGHGTTHLFVACLLAACMAACAAQDTTIELKIPLAGIVSKVKAEVGAALEKHTYTKEKEKMEVPSYSVAVKGDHLHARVDLKYAKNVYEAWLPVAGYMEVDLSPTIEGDAIAWNPKPKLAITELLGVEMASSDVPSQVASQPLFETDGVIAETVMAKLSDQFPTSVSALMNKHRAELAKTNPPLNNDEVWDVLVGHIKECASARIAGGKLVVALHPQALVKLLPNVADILASLLANGEL